MSSIVEITEDRPTVTVDGESLSLTVSAGITRLQDASDLSGTAGTGKGWVRDETGAMVWTDLATQAELDAHTALGATAHTGLGVGDVDPDWSWNQFPLPTGGGNPGANAAFGMRVPVGKTGTISDIVMGIIGSSGNVDIGVFSFDGTTYTALWRKGSTVCPPANTMTSMGNPGAAVTRGQVVYVLNATDNVSCTFARAAVLSAASLGQIAALGTAQRLSFWVGSAFPLPATILESAVFQITDLPITGFKIT